MGAIMLLMLLTKAASCRKHTAVCDERMLTYVGLSTSEELTASVPPHLMQLSILLTSNFLTPSLHITARLTWPPLRKHCEDQT